MDVKHDTEERREQVYAGFKKECFRKLLRIPWTKLLTTEQMYKMDGVESEVLNRVR